MLWFLPSVFWILFFSCSSFPAGLVVSLLYAFSFIVWCFLLRCLLILYYILFFYRQRQREKSLIKKSVRMISLSARLRQWPSTLLLRSATSPVLLEFHGNRALRWLPRAVCAKLPYRISNLESDGRNLVATLHRKNPHGGAKCNPRNVA